MSSPDLETVQNRIVTLMNDIVSEGHGGSYTVSVTGQPLSIGMRHDGDDFFTAEEAAAISADATPDGMTLIVVTKSKDMLINLASLDIERQFEALYWLRFYARHAGGSLVLRKRWHDDKRAFIVSVNAVGNTLHIS